MAPEVQENEFSGSVEHRLERLIFYATRHGMLITQFSGSLDDVRHRIGRLEDDRQRREINDARVEEQTKAMTAALKGLQDQVAGMKSVMNKAVGIIAGALLLALIKWVLDGNLAG